MNHRAQRRSRSTSARVPFVDTTCVRLVLSLCMGKRRQFVTTATTYSVSHYNLSYTRTDASRKWAVAFFFSFGALSRTTRASLPFALPGGFWSKSPVHDSPACVRCAGQIAARRCKRLVNPPALECLVSFGLDFRHRDRGAASPCSR